MFRIGYALLFFVFLAFSAEAGIKDRVKRLAPNGLVFVLDEKGKTLVSQNANKPFVPASVAKIVTAWLALEVLGEDYRFETKFYMDTNRVLYVRGSGDPYLVSEELALLAPELLKATGKKPFTAMVLDTSYYPQGLTIPGIENDDEAYNALNSALAVNFNTIHARRKGKSVRSAEKQTPITPIAVSQFRKRAPNGRSRISLTQEDPKISSLYAGELLSAFIKRSGGKVAGDISIGQVADGLSPVYVHRQSRPLSEIVHQMMLGSNNYIANQLFLEAGVYEQDNPVSVESSLSSLDELLKKFKLNDGIKLLEGSGISRENRITARGLAELLHHFEPHAELMKRTKRGSRYKTGTMSGVSTLAGFAKTAEHGMVRFVIALPGRSGKLRFSILRAIERGL
ncbi:MAG: D-alanyl-D-alanine carboxypeptidase [Pseudomonadota bacterium]